MIVAVQAAHGFAFDLGDVPAWFGGLGTVGALVYIALQWRQDRHSRRREQASRVFVWIDKVSSHHEAPDRSVANIEGLVVDNGSDGPLFDVSVRLLPWLWQRDSEPVMSRHYRAIKAQTQSEPVDLLDLADPPARTDPDDSWTPPIELRFTDGQGLRWRRLPDGSLEERKRSKRH